jgi:hypothetical protein
MRDAAAQATTAYRALRLVEAFASLAVGFTATGVISGAFALSAFSVPVKSDTGS